MTNHKARLSKLEKIREAQPAQRIDVIEIHKAYEDGRTEIEFIQVAHEQP
jgi:hypothetical protein